MVADLASNLKWFIRPAELLLMFAFFDERLVKP